MLHRRTFLGAVSAAACGLRAANPLFADSSADAQRRILSAPLTHSDWMLKPGMKWGDEGVRHMLDACKACGWSRVYWRVHDAGRATYKSKLVAPAGKPDEDNFYNPQTAEDRAILERFTPGLTPQQREEIRRKLASIDYSDFDCLAPAIAYGHKIGLEIHAWVTINEDDHGWGWASEFSKRHPEFRWIRRDGRAYRSQLSFAFPAVRQYKLAVLKELLDNYDLDGVFLDWIRTGDVRDNPQTDADGVADSGYEAPLVEQFQREFGADPHDVPNGDERWVRVRARPQTEFMRAARKLVDGHNRKIPLAVMVGHPWHYRGLLDKIDGNLRGLLLDVETWAREGLFDSCVAAGYYRDGGTPADAWNALNKETGGKSDVWLYAWVPHTVADFERDFTLAKQLGAQQVLFWEADYIDDRPNAAELKHIMRQHAAGMDG